MIADIDLLQRRIGYFFKNEELLIQALTHSSYANERKINKIENYERLEFLGDAVLELTVSRFLFEHYPDMKEGEMTRKRASLVCEPTLSMCARSFDLCDHLLLGKGEEATGGRFRDSILCDVFESVAGAIYLDGGFDAAAEYIQKYLLTDWEKKALFVDSKSILQEKMQKTGTSFGYELVSEEGPANDKIFVVELIVEGRAVSRGEGHSKKGAEQKAAYDYLVGDCK